MLTKGSKPLLITYVALSIKVAKKTSLSICLPFQPLSLAFLFVCSTVVERVPRSAGAALAV
jgi:hypothetical protein